MQIRNIPSLALAIAFAFAGSIHAAPAQDATAVGKSGKALTAQQQRMKNCNAEAKAQSLKGDDRRGFMSTCLKGGSTELAAHADKSAPTPAQLKRKACSAEAKEKGLKGNERKTFVRECISDDAVASAD